MGARYMRMILFFDLPMETSNELRDYTKFRKFLIKEGFIMMQKSVYCKLSLNSTSVSLVRKRIEKVKPSNGLIQLLVITEKQYSKIEYIVGDKSNKSIEESTERLLIL